MTAGTQGIQLTPGARLGWEAALREIEHQAAHWETPDHGETGHLIASALLSAVDIARGGGVECDRAEHAPFLFR